MDVASVSQTFADPKPGYSFYPEDILNQPNPEAILYQVLDSKEFKHAKLFVDKGVKIDTRHKNGWVLLHLTAYSNYFQFSEFLLEKGASPNTLDDYQKTPLYLAANEGHREMVYLLLLHKADAHLGFTSKDEPLLHIAIRHGWLDVFDLLLKRGADLTTEYLGHSALYAAQYAPNIADDARTQMVEKLIQNGINAANKLINLEDSVDTDMLYLVHGLDGWDNFSRKDTPSKVLVMRGMNHLYRSLIALLTSIGISHPLGSEQEIPHLKDAYKILRFMSSLPYWLDFSLSKEGLRIYYPGQDHKIQALQQACNVPKDVVDQLFEQLNQPNSSLAKFDRERLRHNWLEEMWTHTSEEVNTIHCYRP